MTDEKKPNKGKVYDITDKLTLAGEPLKFDPETDELLIDELTDEQRAKLQEAAHRLANAFTLNSDQQAALQELSKKIKTFLNSTFTDEFKQALQQISDNIHPVQLLLKELDELKPFINAELKKGEYGGITIEDIYKDYTPAELLDARHDPDSLFYKVMEAAKAASETAERVTVQHTHDIEYPLDKINGKAWNLLTKDTGGQLEIIFDMLPKRKKAEATAYYSINFDNLGDNVKITKSLQPFDKRVYIAVSALFNAGNDIITATQIYYQMGNTGKPAPNQIQKIDTALSKMTGAQIILDNTAEATVLKNDDIQLKYDGSLLPMERVTALINGQVVDSAIHIFREPPLMTFAKRRKQVTTVDVSLLQSPVNKTDANLAIDDYLIDRISKAKNAKGNSCRILYKTLYEHANITTGSQKSRAPEKIEKYLDYYQQQGFIKRHTAEADGVTIYY